MEVSVIASGSNGNSCLVEDKGVSLLIDAGKSGIEIEKRMNKLGKSMENVDALVLSHSHVDHISGAGVLSRRFDIPVYAMEEYPIGDCELKKFSDKFKVNGLDILPVATSHDVSSCGFVIGRFGLFTDTGIVTDDMQKMMPKLKGVLLESNHDIDMLLRGPYPAFLKQRIIGNDGHLSNVAAAELVKNTGGSLNWTLLGHLSGNNNTVDLVKSTFEQIAGKKDYGVCSREEENGGWDL